MSTVMDLQPSKPVKHQPSGKVRKRVCVGAKFNSPVFNTASQLKFPGKLNTDVTHLEGSDLPLNFLPHSFWKGPFQP
jgi:hypothetical protein